MKRKASRAANTGKQQFSRKQAKIAAGIMASVSYDRDSAGKLVRVANPKARGLLERVFTQLILRGGRPFATQISASEAAAFPSHVPVVGGSYAIAVGLDVDRCATFSTAGAAAVGGDQPIKAAEVASHVAMMGLSRALQLSGVPARGQA